MAEHDPSRVPRVKPCPCCLRRSLLEDQSNLHSEEDASVRRCHSSELDGRPPRLTNPVWFDIYDRVCQDQRLRPQMTENELFEIAAREQRLIDVAAPLLRWGKVEISGKVDVDLPRSGPLTYAGRGPGDRFREGFLPLADMGVVELIGRHEMPNCPELAELLGQPAIELDRRVKEQLAVRQTYHGHPRRKR